MTTLSELGITVEPSGLVSAPDYPYPLPMRLHLNDAGHEALPDFREPVTVQRSTCPDSSGIVYLFDASPNPKYRKASVTADDWFEGFV